MRNTINNYITFIIDDLRFAVPFSKTCRVFRAVLITPLPGSPNTVMGAVNVAGNVVPVMDFRHKIGLAAREIDVSDYFLLVQTKNRRVIFVADAIEGVFHCSGKHITPAGELTPGLKYISGATGDESGLVFIHDLEEFLSSNEESQIRKVLERAGVK